MLNQIRIHVGFPLCLIYFFFLYYLLDEQKVTISGSTDELNLDFIYNKNSSKGLIAHLTKAGDYGTFSLVLNNEKPVLWNGFHKEGVSTARIDLGANKPKEGKNTLKVKYLESAPNSKSGIFGMDYLEFNNIKNESKSKVFNHCNCNCYNSIGFMSNQG